MVVEFFAVDVAEPPPDTLASLTSGDVAFDATSTVTVTAGYENPAFSTSLRVQVSPAAGRSSRTRPSTPWSGRSAACR